MTKHEILLLWEFIAQTWGNKFLEEYGAKPNDAWTMALTAVEPAAAKLALNILIRAGSAFAPTLPEFIGATKAYRKPEDRATVHLLPQPDPEKARANLDRIRKMLSEP
jgi:hypothetical protein